MIICSTERQLETHLCVGTCTKKICYFRKNTSDLSLPVLQAERSSEQTITLTANKSTSAITRGCRLPMYLLDKIMSTPTRRMRGHIPLQHSQFVSELANHPDKAFVSWFLYSVDNGVSLGYTGLRANVHPLAKGCAAGRILGPFLTPPFLILCCSVPKKNG